MVAILLFCCILSGYLLSFNVDQPAHNGDWYIRYQVTCSIVERNSFAIRPYQVDARTGPGVGGHIYAQYMLGQSTALIPLYLVGRVLAGRAHTNCARGVAPPIVFLTCKTLDLILGALLCLLFFATARLLGYAPRLALGLTLLLAFGTSLWPDVLSNLEHTQESLLLLVSAYAALRYTLARRPTALWVLVMGVAVGLMFVTRFDGLIAAPLFALYLLVLHHRRPRPAVVGWRLLWRDLGLFTAGILPAALVNAAYDVIRFGTPLRTQPHPVQILGFPPWVGVPDLLLSPGKGLLWYTPAAILLALAAGPFRQRWPLPTVLFSLLCGGYLVFYANVPYWHGDPAWGPRYLYPLLPYLILPLGELWQRWPAYRFPTRGLIVGVLASSFLVQLTAVSVSFWRHFHDIFGAHYDQVQHYIWGDNLNYWWSPDQSPIVISLAGIADITQKYIDHAPFVQHAPDQRLGSANESCVFRVFGHASICLTHLDDFHERANWNTFSMWWLHTYPWWHESTIVGLALALLAVFLASGAALLALLAPTPHRPAPSASAQTIHPSVSGGGQGKSSRRPGAMTRPTAAVSAQPATAPPTVPRSRGPRKRIALVRLVPRAVAPAHAPAVRPATGLGPLGLSVLAAMLAYGTIMGVAAAQAPRRASPLFRTVPMAVTVYDGSWGYRVLRVTNVPALPGGLALPPTGWHDVIVQLLLRNLSARPPEMRLAYFSLASATGAAYPAATGLDGPVAELYHVSPLWRSIPPRSVVQSVLVYLSPHGARHLALLGPGIALVRLADPQSVTSWDQRALTACYQLNRGACV